MWLTKRDLSFFRHSSGSSYLIVNMLGLLIKCISYTQTKENKGEWFMWNRSFYPKGLIPCPNVWSVCSCRTGLSSVIRTCTLWSGTGTTAWPAWVQCVERRSRPLPQNSAWIVKSSRWNKTLTLHSWLKENGFSWEGGLAALKQYLTFALCRNSWYGTRLGCI